MGLREYGKIHRYEGKSCEFPHICKGKIIGRMIHWICKAQKLERREKDWPGKKTCFIGETAPMTQWEIIRCWSAGKWKKQKAVCGEAAGSDGRTGRGRCLSFVSTVFWGSDSKRGGAALRVQPENHYKPEKADLKRIKWKTESDRDQGRMLLKKNPARNSTATLRHDVAKWLFPWTKFKGHPWSV